MASSTSLSVKDFQQKWKHQLGQIPERSPVLILSQHGLSAEKLSEFVRDYCHCPISQGISTILSLKMMHIYFRIGENTYDYRPHRGSFSGLHVNPYRLSQTDRVEVLLNFSNSEMKNLYLYFKNILASRASVLGKAHPLQLSEPDFTVRAHQTTRKLDHNIFINSDLRHNCLTWFTLAPIGSHGETIAELLDMNSTDFESEAHSYIVAFQKFLLENANPERIASVLLWTKDSVSEAIEKRTQNPTLPHPHV